MSTIAIFIDGEVAHLRPTLRLAESLRQRGHKVWYLGFASLKETAERMGYRFQTLFEELCPVSETTATDAPTASRIFEKLLSGEALDSFFQEMQPEVVVTLTIFASVALVLKFRYEVPVLLVRTHCTESIRNQVLDNVMGSAMVQMGGSVSQLCKLLGSKGYTVDTLDDVIAAALKMPEIVLLPEEFGIVGESDPLLTYIGMDVAGDNDSRPFHEPWLSQDDADTRPLIYCSLGTRPDMRPALSRRFFGDVICAVGSEDRLRLILSTGDQFRVEEFPNYPNVRVHTWVPQL